MRLGWRTGCGYRFSLRVIIGNGTVRQLCVCHDPDRDLSRRDEHNTHTLGSQSKGEVESGQSEYFDGMPSVGSDWLATCTR